MHWLVLLFLVVPLLELGFLVWAGGHIGIWPTLGLTLASAVIGGADISFAGMPEWRKYKKVYPMPASCLRNGLPIC